MEKEVLLKWKHFDPDIILLTVRWYLRYNLTFRNLVEMMEERGLVMAHTTIMHWVHRYGPELDTCKDVSRHATFLLLKLGCGKNSLQPVARLPLLFSHTLILRKIKFASLKKSRAASCDSWQIVEKTLDELTRTATRRFGLTVLQNCPAVLLSMRVRVL